MLFFFQPCKSSSSFPSRGEFGQRILQGDKKHFLSLLCCAVRFETPLPQNNTLQSYFMLLLLAGLSPTLGIIGHHFHLREPVAAVNLKYYYSNSVRDCSKRFNLKKAMWHSVRRLHRQEMDSHINRILTTLVGTQPKR